MLSGLKTARYERSFLLTVPELGRSELFEFLEFPVEIGQVVEATLEGDFGDLHVFSLLKQTASLTDSNLKHEVDVCFVGALFEVSAEGVWAHACYFSSP